MDYTGMCHSTGYGFCLSESFWNRVYKSAFLVWYRVYFLPFRLWITVGVTILRPESHYKRTLLLFPLGSRCTFTQTRRFRLEVTSSHVFNLEQGIYFHNFVATLRLFSLEQGQVLRHSAAHPHTKLRGVPSPPSPLPPPPPPRAFRLSFECRVFE